jgi:hypothetical protein
MSLEYCCLCDEPTGRAGRGEDSIYVEAGDGEIGPLCLDCYDRLLDEGKVIDA